MRTNMSKYKNTRHLVMDILRGRWLLDSTSSSNLLEAASSFLSRTPVTPPAEDLRPFLIDMEGTRAQGDGEPSEDSLVLVVPIHGTLTKYDNCFGTSTMEVADILEAYRQREDIVGFVLDIDSPGGAVNAVMPLVEEIRRIQADGKPVIVHTDFAASAAYWIASQCDAIFMDNLLSEVGSIGACSVVVDDRENKQTGVRTLTVYANESPDKNKSYRNALDGDFTALQAELDGIVGMFRQAVKSGRPDIDADAPGLMTGAIFSTAEALKRNMADGMAQLEDCVQIAFVRAHDFNK